MLFNFDQEVLMGESKVFKTELIHYKNNDMIKVIAAKSISVSPQISFKSHIGIMFNSTDKRTVNIYKPVIKPNTTVYTEFYSFRSIKSWSALSLTIDNKGYDDKITIRKGSTICYLVPIDGLLNYEEIT